MILFGLPGLYQNWLMAAADPTSSIQTHGDYNFFCSQSRFKWTIKTVSAQLPNGDDTIVVNQYVKRMNVPWYLYNMLEKTYDIRIMVDNLAADLIDRGQHFALHNNFRESILELDYSDNNQIINFFFRYFYDTQPADIKVFNRLAYTNSNYINVEYEDFSYPDKLKNILRTLPQFDENHFDNMYELLAKTNQRYLNRKKDFLNKFNSNEPFDVIELGVIGCIVAAMTDVENLQWGNQSFREKILKIKFNEIKDFALNVC